MTADLIDAQPIPRSGDGRLPLLDSKLAVPEPSRFTIARPRLLERLTRSAHEPVTLVVAPAGSGKTQLAASWAAGRPEVAWVTLDAGDEDAGEFWGYVAEALRRSGVSVPPPGAADRAFLTRLAAALCARDVPVVLVLDGVSRLSGHQWAADLEFLVRHSSRRLRLVLLARWDPPMPLHRYRLAGRFNEFRGEDLVFTAPEAAEVLARHDVVLDPGPMSTVLERTQGWPAGVRLFALEMQGGDDPAGRLARLTGEEGTIAAFFTDEVLRDQPPPVRRFLLETSVLDDFPPDLADRVTGRDDAGRLLATLERRNAFVRSVDGAYRYHPLFAEMLRARLGHEVSDRVPELHRRAADWFADRRRTGEAVRHAVRAGDWPAAATMVVNAGALGRLMLDGRHGPLGRSLTALPPAPDRPALTDGPGRRPRPEAHVVAAALALADGRADDCAKHLGRAEELAAAAGRQDDRVLATSIIVLEVLLADALRDSSRVLHSASVAEYLLGQDPDGGRAELRVLVLTAKGMAQSRLGDAEAAAVTLGGAAELGTATAGCERPTIECLRHLALLEAYRGRLGAAERLANRAIELAEQAGPDPARPPGPAEVALAWVAMERYEVDVAGRHLRTAVARGHRNADGLVAAAYGVVRARRLQARGELRNAMQALQDAAAAPGSPPPEWLAREVTLCRARLLVAGGRAGDALAAVARFPEPHTPDVTVVHAAALVAAGDLTSARQLAVPLTRAPGLPGPVIVDAWLVLASAAAQAGDLEQARTALRQALRQAGPERQCRAVQQVWADLRRILRDDEELRELIRRLHQPGQRGARRPDDTPPPPVLERLSRREMEVLNGMAAMLPTEEIAATLFVSINTVKTHVRSILRKLSASRRNEAVRRARELGLL